MRNDNLIEPMLMFVDDIVILGYFIPTYPDKTYFWWDFPDGYPPEEYIGKM